MITTIQRPILSYQRRYSSDLILSLFMISMYWSLSYIYLFMLSIYDLVINLNRRVVETPALLNALIGFYFHRFVDISLLLYMLFNADILKITILFNYCLKQSILSEPFSQPINPRFYRPVPIDFYNDLTQYVLIFLQVPFLQMAPHQLTAVIIAIILITIMNATFHHANIDYTNELNII